MYSLPETLATKFRFYLNVLPTAEQGSMYMFFASGALLLLYSVVKFVNFSKKPQNFYNSPYLEEEFGHKQRKLDCYLPEKRASMTKQELEDYFSSLVTPLNQEISFLEFQEMKEEIVWII